MRPSHAMALGLPTLAVAVGGAVLIRQARTIRHLAACRDAADSARRFYEALDRRGIQLDAAPDGLPHLRDMGATLVDKARARLMEAQAAEIEQRVRAEALPPPDNGANPVLCESSLYEADASAGLVLATLADAAGREYRLHLSAGLAEVSALALLEATQRAAPRGDRSGAESVRRRTEGA